MLPGRVSFGVLQFHCNFDLSFLTYTLFHVYAGYAGHPVDGSDMMAAMSFMQKQKNMCICSKDLHTSLHFGSG